MEEAEKCIYSLKLYDFDRSGWISGIKLFTDIEMIARLARDPPSNLTAEQQFEWGNINAACLKEYLKQGKI